MRIVDVPTRRRDARADVDEARWPMRDPRSNSFDSHVHELLFSLDTNTPDVRFKTSEAALAASRTENKENPDASILLNVPKYM